MGNCASEPSRCISCWTNFASYVPREEVRVEEVLWIIACMSIVEDLYGSECMNGMNDCGTMKEKDKAECCY